MCQVECEYQIYQHCGYELFLAQKQLDTIIK